MNFHNNIAQRFRPLACISALFVLQACAALRPATIPMRVVEHPIAQTADGDAPQGLIVLFPGYGDRPEKFARKGFVDILEDRGVAFDVVALDAHFGYYRAQTVLDRVYEDVLRPAVESGVDEIWIVGISMGGAGVISTAERYDDIIDGVIAIAPYLGPSSLIDEIQSAGGLMAWEPGELEDVPSTRDQFFRRQWAWLQGYGTDEPRPELRLGVGSKDRLFTPASMIAEVLPEEDWLMLQGGHNWRVWTPMFEHLSMGVGLPER